MNMRPMTAFAIMRATSHLLGLRVADSVSLSIEMTTEQAEPNEHGAQIERVGNATESDGMVNLIQWRECARFSGRQYRGQAAVAD
jgi:hypothetical protein